MITQNNDPHLNNTQWFTYLGALCIALASALPVAGQSGGGKRPLKAERVMIDIDAPEEEIVRIAIPDLGGNNNANATKGSEVLRNDFRLMPGFRVIGKQSIQHSVDAQSARIDVAKWASLRANGVILGTVSRSSTGLQANLRFYKLSDGQEPALQRNYRGDGNDVRRWMHDFVNRVIGELTGQRGVFGTEIAFARRHGPGKKDVYLSSMDGFGVRRISSGRGVSMLPAFGPRRLWFTRMAKGTMYITHGRARSRPIISGKGLNMAPVQCGSRVYFTSSRDGNSEIYSADANGRNVRRLTNHRSIDLSPTCGPGGKLAFVSNRHGSPQVFTMNSDGSNVKRITFRGNYNQTPVWCMDPKTPLIAFTGRERGLDIFTVNLATGEFTRVTQGQGENKDPAFSPDCRMLAFASTRRGAPGVYVSSPDGRDQSLVVKGVAETVRWHQ